MTPAEKQTAMLKWLKSQKKAAEYEELITAEHHGATQYVKEQNDKAAMIEEIIKTIEKLYNFNTGHASVNEIRGLVGLESIDKETGFSYILHTKGGKYPSMIAFKSSEEAEQFVDKNNLKNCSLTSVQYGKKEWYE